MAHEPTRLQISNRIDPYSPPEIAARIQASGVSGLLNYLLSASPRETLKRNHRHVGICGEAPANYPAVARFLVELGIDSISVKPASLMRTMTIAHEAEKAIVAVPSAAE